MHSLTQLPRLHRSIVSSPPSRLRPLERLACHENLECLLAPSRDQYLHCVSEEAAAWPLYRASLPPRALVPVHLSRRFRPFLKDWDVIRRSDLVGALSARGATGFIPSYRSSAALEAWGQEVGLELIAPPAPLQRALEDKLRFNRLLAREGLPAPRGFELAEPAAVASLRGFPLVVQVAASEGMGGTYLVRSARALSRLLCERQLKLPLLCRQYVEGLVLGVTLVVGPEQLLLSAARFQCRGLGRHGDSLPGVQWAARSRFDAAQRRALERTLERLGRALQRQGFRGAANIDLILRGSEVLIIECNPRFSAATPQLSQEPELLHGLDFVVEHRRALAGRPLSAHVPRLPRTSFEGAYVDLSDWLVAQLHAAGRRVVHRMPELGVYEMSGDAPTWISHNVGALSGPCRALFYYSTPAGARVGVKSDLGALLSNAPLFYPEPGGAVLTTKGERLIHGFLREVRVTRPDRSLADLAAASSLKHRGQAPGAALISDSPSARRRRQRLSIDLRRKRP